MGACSSSMKGMDNFTDVCGVVMLRNMGLPVPFARNGPENALTLMEFMTPFGVEFDLVQMGSTMRDGKYGVLNKEKSHWTNLFAKEGMLLEKDGDRVTTKPLSYWWQLVNNPSMVLFRLGARKGGIDPLYKRSKSMIAEYHEVAGAGLAPTYANVPEFERMIAQNDFNTRTDYLEKVKFGQITDTGSLPNHPSTAIMVFAQELGLVPKSHRCEDCRGWYTMRHTLSNDGRAKWQWRGPRYNDGCDSCNGKCESMVKGTILEHVRVERWADFMDVLIMWLHDYPKLLMVRESGMNHTNLEAWLDMLQSKANQYINGQLSFTDFYNEHQRKERLRRLAAARAGRRFVPNRIVVEADELFLNRGKLTHLAGHVRPQQDKLWLWGCTIKDHPEYFFFKVLEHPNDAFDGRPRGTNELISCFDSVGLKPGIILVTDSWRGSIAAIRSIKQRNNWGPRSLRHELVNHSSGEVVNANGFTTNHIECRWSVLRAWVRKRFGGKFPAYTDRRRWKKVINEFQYRKFASKGHTIDHGHTFIVPTKVFCCHAGSV